MIADEITYPEIVLGDAGFARVEIWTQPEFDGLINRHHIPKGKIVIRSLEMNRRSAEAVSYTHLDVYKRQ